MILLFNRFEDQEKTNSLVRGQHHVSIGIYQKKNEMVAEFHESLSKGANRGYGLVSSKESLQITHQKTAFKPMNASALWVLLMRLDTVLCPWLKPVLFFNMGEMHDLATRAGARRYGMFWASSYTDTNLPYVVGRTSKAAKDMDDFMFSSSKTRLACFSITLMLQEFMQPSEFYVTKKEHQDVAQKTFKKLSPKNFQKSFDLK